MKAADASSPQSWALLCPETSTKRQVCHLLSLAYAAVAHCKDTNTTATTSIVYVGRLVGVLRYQHDHVYAAQVNATAAAVVESTIDMYNQIRTQLLPTPSKPHYTFNLRDVARVIQGVMRADPKSTTESDQLVTLWLHEASRVFADRLVNAEDNAWFRQASLCCMQLPPAPLTSM